MDSKEILEDLRRRFGDKTMLDSADIAAILSRSPEAANTLIRRGGLTLPVEKVGGQNCVSIYAAADWLAGKCPEPTKKLKKITDGAQVLPPPSRNRPSIAASLLCLQTQQDFLRAVYAGIERIAIESQDDDEATW